MFSYFLNWLVAFLLRQKNLDQVLDAFNKVHDDLSKFIDKTEATINKKGNTVTTLQKQIEDHHAYNARASRILENVKRLLNQ